PVEVERVAEARVAGRDRIRLSVDGKGDVAHEPLVEDRVKGGAIEDAALGMPPHPGAVGDLQRIGSTLAHDSTIATTWPDDKSHFGYILSDQLRTSIVIDRRQ